MKNALLIFLFIGSFSAFGQNDSVFAVKKGTVLAIKHVLQERETLKMLAQRYYTTVVEMQGINEFESKGKFSPGDFIYVPLTSKNFFLHKKPIDVTDLHDVYYRVRAKDNMNMVISYFPIRENEKPMSKEELRNMNGMKGYNIEPEQSLFIGWLKMIPKDSLNVEMGIGYPKPEKVIKTEKSIVKQKPGELETVFNTSTQNGNNVLNEKGTAVFFDKPGKNDVFYAFHNTTPRNTVVKVTNPGNNKMIFVKIIGPIPETKMYANCIIAISNSAKEELGVTDSRAWLELSYPAN